MGSFGSASLQHGLQHGLHMGAGLGKHGHRSTSGKSPQHHCPEEQPKPEEKAKPGATRPVNRHVATSTL